MFWSKIPVLVFVIFMTVQSSVQHDMTHAIEVSVWYVASDMYKCECVTGLPKH